ncbi:Thiolase [Niveomyces insectorum RCEF 264]|uniref:acetyl-CoA C-acetyltransferase n=1 Tax=Niveomyces insectorum RCEF 264 TaxID=1081102 RepID=A0A167T3Y3_9HYPO|nr:Thiolase [Niveomyces insectorum RCEF 264]
MNNAERARSRLGHIQEHLSPALNPQGKIRDVYIISAARTPTAKFNGAFKSISATQLGAVAIRGALAKTSVPVQDIRDVYMGNVLQAGEGQAPARQAMLFAGLPTSIEAVTVNKVCSSGLKAVMQAAQNIQLGLADAQIAGGMESMSRVPYYVPRAAQNPAFGNVQLEDGLIKDGLWDVYEQFHMGSCAEHSAKQFGITRQAQDAYAVRSFKRAQKAWMEHKFDEEIVPVIVKQRRVAGGEQEITVQEDEGYKNLNEAKLSTLQPAFVKDGTGTVTAANSSTMNDGASALVLASADVAARHGQKSRVLSRIVAYADAAVDPIDYSIAPAKAISLALHRAGLEKKDIALWEVNEAFAVVIKVTEQLLGLDDDTTRINTVGGAIALGHALGSSGSRLLTTLVHQLAVGEYGVVALCNGGGAGSAMVVQRVDSV